MESILTSIKQLLGVDEADDHFDMDIMFHINSTFSDLYQMGVGPEPFSIDDASQVWSDFVGDDAELFNNVKSYMYLKVKLLFDPPTNSSVLSAMERRVAEYEWRLTVNASNKLMEENEDA